LRGFFIFIPYQEHTIVSTLLPTDTNNNPIPVMRLRPGFAQSIAVTASSARNTTAFDSLTRVIGVYATVPMFVRLGNSSVTATVTDHYLPADTYMDIAIAGSATQSYTNIAAIRAVSDGILYVSEKF
jgi:hypothetical protein